MKEAEIKGRSDRMERPRCVERELHYTLIGSRASNQELIHCDGNGSRLSARREIKRLPSVGFVDIGKFGNCSRPGESNLITSTNLNWYSLSFDENMNETRVDASVVKIKTHIGKDEFQRSIE